MKMETEKIARIARIAKILISRRQLLQVLGSEVKFCNLNTFFFVPLFGVRKGADMGTAIRAAWIAIIDFGSQKWQSEQSELNFSIQVNF